ncbi:MAG: ribonuclease HI [Candidatus Fermentimicrarchaeum limneticum]|uniref:Ribonuclease HI n=1 Tax=Fermentimicrarchaeum limneticum TaxID=2795018 RepID=A0A7D5XFR6_FERL1|nr:MAG: ribonuclease HI [Candidatus Fermentimicrarchaeum limneticum]
MKIWIDGSGWNGRVSRYALAFEDGKTEIVETAEDKTNNTMEYAALIKALEEAKNGDEILTDSKLIVGQVTGGWKIHKPHLFEFVAKAKKLLKEKDVKIRWLPREENKAGHLLEC